MVWLAVLSVVIVLAGCVEQKPEDDGTVWIPPSEAPIPEDLPFSTHSCYEEYFPVALTMPTGALPGEIKLYCLANWDFAALHEVREALDSSKFDLVAALVRSADENKKSALQTILRMSKEQADNGPEGLGDIWYLHKIMPALQALHEKKGDVKIVESQFAPEDVAALRVAVSKIDWERPIEKSEKSEKSLVNVGEESKPRRVTDLSAEVLRLSQ